MRRLSTIALALGAAMLLSGCLFHIEHKVPVDATFGRATSVVALRTPFQNRHIKRYILGGTIPWSLSYGEDHKRVKNSTGRRIESLEIKTRFNPIDALMRFVPYLGYVLAQRTVYIQGVYVDPPAAETP